MVVHPFADPEGSDIIVRQLRNCAETLQIVFLTTGLGLLAPVLPASAFQAPQSTTAIVGATLIDGNGGPPIADATIVVEGTRIAAIGPRSEVQVPEGAQVIDGAGKYVTPGFIDTNVHMSLSFGRRWSETNARYWDRNADLNLQGAQLHLKHGVTTIRDSYGALLPGMQVRDAIARGEAVGPRMYVAGNIVGWGGPFSETFSGDRESELTLFEEQINDSITLGTGEELMHMTPEELRVAMNAYLDLGPDFIKYGGTHHFNYPTTIGFSPRPSGSSSRRRRNAVWWLRSTPRLSRGFDSPSSPESTSFSTPKSRPCGRLPTNSSK